MLGIIFRFKQELEFRATIQYLNELKVILSDEMLDHRIPLKSILKPLCVTKVVYFRIRVLHTTRLEVLKDYVSQLSNNNINKFQYYRDLYNTTTKFDIRFKKPTPIYPLNLTKKVGVKRDEQNTWDIENISLIQHAWGTTDVSFMVLRPEEE